MQASYLPGWAEQETLPRQRCKVYSVSHCTVQALKKDKFSETRRCGPLRGPSSSSCGGLWPSAEAFFCPSRKKKSFMSVLAHILVIFGDQ